MSIKLTPKQTALLTAIGNQEFSFFDDGVTEGSGTWSEVLTHEAGPEVAANPKGVARVAGSLVNKGLLGSYVDEDENDTWFYLTAEGAELAQALANKSTPVEEEEDVLGEVAEEENPFQLELISYSVDEVLDNATVHTERDEDGAEWTRTTFADGSYTLKRRRQVSGAWRTDYWGCEAGADKQVFCLSRDAKRALAQGSFTVA